MLKNIIRHPIFLSTVLAIVFIGGLSAAHFWAPDTVTKTIWFIGIGVIALIFLAYQAVLFVRKRKQNKDQQLETEEEALSLVINLCLIILKLSRYI